MAFLENCFIFRYKKISKLHIDRRSLNSRLYPLLECNKFYLNLFVFRAYFSINHRVWIFFGDVDALEATCELCVRLGEIIPFRFPWDSEQVLRANQSLPEDLIRSKSNWQGINESDRLGQSGNAFMDSPVIMFLPNPCQRGKEKNRHQPDDERTP